jgi:hypothetical protein
MQRTRQKSDAPSPSISSDVAFSKYWVINQLLNPDRNLFAALCEIILMKDLDSDLPASLVQFYEINSQLVDVVNWIVSREIVQTKEKATLFRGSSPVTKFFRIIFQKEGSEYLKFLIEPLLKNFISKSWENFDSVPTTQQLLELLEKFINQFTSSQDKCPLIIKKLLTHLRKEVTTQFSSETFAISIIGGFVFLRFLCPAIMTPHQSGLLQDVAISGSVQKALLEATRLLQNIANGIENTNITNKSEDVKSLYLQFIKKYSAPIRDTLYQLSDLRHSQPKKPSSLLTGDKVRKSVSHDDLSRVPKPEPKLFSDSSGESEKVISYILSMILQHKEEIQKFLDKEKQEKEKENNITKSEKILQPGTGTLVKPKPIKSKDSIALKKSSQDDIKSSFNKQEKTENDAKIEFLKKKTESRRFQIYTQRNQRIGFQTIGSL